MSLERPIGFVGVGKMGTAMATRVLNLGHEAVVFDIEASACDHLAGLGASIAASPAEVAERCSVVSVVVNSDDQVRTAVLGKTGIVECENSSPIVAIHSTIHMETFEEVANAASEKSFRVIEATVTGGADAALRGELAVLLGGDPAQIDEIRPALSTYASLVLRVGDAGAGMAAKLALMVVSFGKLAATHEGILLAKSAGVDLKQFNRIVTHSEAQSGLHEFFLRERIASYDMNYSGSLPEIANHESPKSQKDLHAALVLAERLGIDLPVTRINHDEMPKTWGAE
ncbi:NAD(P)-dependent oxidoreductase [Myxococcota bacterium]|nr:NAD(P)-dependent oxidoreductase [Myxococcota bacterium]